MDDLAEIDFFTDETIVDDPHPYYERLRARGPAVRLPHRNVVAVVGYDEGLAVYRDDEHFSSVVVANGPIPPIPFTPEGDDITDQIEAHRGLIPAAGTIVATDPPEHARLKALLMGIITPRRLKENEAFLWRLAAQQIDTFAERGACEAVQEYAAPFTTYAIADLLGVPEADYDKIRNQNTMPPGALGRGSEGTPNNPFEKITNYFIEYVEERRRAPRGDVMSDLAAVRFGDGSLPPVEAVVSVASFLFGAGEDTTTRTIAAAFRFLAEDPALQRRLRAERELIPEFVEETLRLDGTVKSDFRLVKRPVRIGDLDVAPGTVVALMVNAMNRDPRRFDDPYAFRLDRRNLREHIAFGRGIHACAGAPLARAEVKVTLESFFDRFSDIRVDAGKHGPPEARRFPRMKTYLLQGLAELHLELDAA
jgi:cytochrome P450